VEASDPWVGQILAMGLLLLVAGVVLTHLVSCRDIEYEFEVASRILRIRSILGQLYTGLGARVWKYWEFEVGDLM